MYLVKYDVTCLKGNSVAPMQCHANDAVTVNACA